MKKQIRSLTARMIAVTVVAILFASAAPAMAGVIGGIESNPVRAKFTSALAPMPVPVVKMGRVMAEADAPADSPARVDAPDSTATPAEAANPAPAAVPAVNDPEGNQALAATVTRAQAAIPVPVTVPAKPQSGSSSAPSVVRTAPSGGDELAQAKAILNGLIAKHPILAGTTVSIGTTPGGYQAVAYYQSGRIVISSSHTASLATILNHEVWHIIDWRDNGVIDWGENIPPR